MANNKKSSPSEDPKVKAQQEKLKAKMEKERQKAAKKREKDRAKQQRDAERYEKQAAEARRKAAAAREERERLANDPAHQEKLRREQERLKEKGRKKIERDRKKQAKRAAQAEKERKRIQNERINKGLAAVPAQKRDERGSGRSAKPSLDEGTRRKRGSVACLVAILVITIGAAIMLYPPQDSITMGLDIQGGVSVNLRATTTDGGAPTSEQMEEAQRVISSRVNSSGASAATVQQQGSDSFLVQVPGADNSQAILDTLGSQGVLEFARVDSIQDEKARNYVNQGITGMNLKDEGISYDAFMTGDSVERATVGRAERSADYAVDLQLDADGTRSFGEVSSELVSDHGKIAIILDGEVKSAPAVQSAITTGQVQITGNYSSEEANSLKAIIDSGSLPVSLEIQQSSVVGPILGQNALTVGLISAGIGLALVIVWLLLFYNGLGLLTGVSILIMSVVYLGLLAFLSFAGWFSLTLPGIAGIIVNIGLSADSSILIMECFHEQIREGKSFKTAAKNGVHEGIFTSLDADGVTLVSALILYFVAIGDVRGFGLTLALGIICDLLIMALFSGPVIRLLGPGVIRRHPAFWGVADDMHEGAYIAELNETAGFAPAEKRAPAKTPEAREAEALERAEAARKAKAARRAKAAKRSAAGKQPVKQEAELSAAWGRKAEQEPDGQEQQAQATEAGAEEGEVM